MIVRSNQRVLVGLLVVSQLAIATSASANAWLLWYVVQTIDYKGSGSTQTPWTLIETLPDYQECEHLLSEKVNMFAQLPTATNKHVQILGHIRTNTWYEGAEPIASQTWRYDCFPATVDPRGPKGK